MSKMNVFWELMLRQCFCCFQFRIYFLLKFENVFTATFLKIQKFKWGQKEWSFLFWMDGG